MSEDKQQQPPSYLDQPQQQWHPSMGSPTVHPAPPSPQFMGAHSPHGSQPPQIYQPQSQQPMYPGAQFPNVQYSQPGAAGGSVGTTVIVNQPNSGNASRLWTTGLCSFCDDVGICCSGMCCPGILLAKTAGDMGESCCLGCIVANAAVLLRTKWRTQEKIEGSILDDCMVMTCCGPCGMCQLAREVKAKMNGTLRT